MSANSSGADAATNAPRPPAPRFRRRCGAPAGEKLRLSELAELAADIGPDARNMGAVLMLAGPPPSQADLVRRIEDILPRTPELTTRLERPAHGRPVWIRDTHVDVGAHLHLEACPGDGAEADLLDLAARILARQLSLDQPAWSINIVTGCADGDSALVVSVHHGLTDGPGVLSTFAALLDEGPRGTTNPDRSPAAGAAGSAEAARTGRLRAPSRLNLLRGLGHAVRTLGLATVDILASAGRRAPRTSFNRPITAGFRLATAEADLQSLRSVGHRHGATINDILLTVVGHSIGRLLAARGENVPGVVISIPVTFQTVAPTVTDQASGNPSSGGPGSAAGRPPRARNRAGILRVMVPTRRPDETAAEHLTRVARITRARKRWLNGESPALLAPAFYALGALGLYRPMIERQRLITTLLTNLRGPAHAVEAAGARIRRIVPIAPMQGNVPLSFTTLSYDGRLVLTVRAAPALYAELPAVRASLAAGLSELAGLGHK